MPQLRLSLDEAAHHLGISVSTLRRRIKARAPTAEWEEVEGGRRYKVEQEPTASGFRYVVLLDEGEAGEGNGDPGAPAHTASPDPATTAHLAEVIEERDWLRRRVEEQERTIDRLTAQAENSQVLLARAQESLQLLLAERTETAAAEADQAPTQTDSQVSRPAEQKSNTLIERVRRWLWPRS